MLPRLFGGARSILKRALYLGGNLPSAPAGRTCPRSSIDPFCWCRGDQSRALRPRLKLVPLPRRDSSRQTAPAGRTCTGCSPPLTPATIRAHRKPLYRPIIRRIMVVPRLLTRARGLSLIKLTLFLGIHWTRQRQQAALALDHRPAHHGGVEARFRGERPRLKLVLLPRLALRSVGRPHLHRQLTRQPSLDARHQPVSDL